MQIEGYEVVGEIGRGGFGIVHRARQIGLDRDVAIKVIAAGRMDADAVRRFERECRVLGRLSDHPNIVTVHGSGFTAAQEPFIAMEFLAQGSLADQLVTSGAMGWQEACSHVVKLAGALETAHRAGVLHRDVKPENVLLSSYGEPMLADFGIATVADGTRTQAGALTASLGHAAPEILDGRDPSPASDVYALASTLFQLLAGSMAFDPGEGGVVAMIGKVLNRPVPDLRPAGVPDGICRVVEDGMAKTPDARPATAEAFGRRLADAAASAGLPLPDLVIGTRVEPEPVEAAIPTAPDPGAMATRVHGRADVEAAAARQAPKDDVPARGGLPPVPVQDTVDPDGRTAARRPRWLVPAGAGVAVALAVGVAVAVGGGGGGDGRDDTTGDELGPSASASDGTPGDGSVPGPMAPIAANTGEGRVLWTRAPDPVADADDLAGPVQVRPMGGVLVTLGEDVVQAVDANTGTLAWSRSVNMLGNPPAPIPLPGDAVLVQSFGDWVAFDLSTGEERYRVRADEVRVVGDLLIDQNFRAVHAFDAATGEFRWSHDELEDISPIVGDQPDGSSVIAVLEGNEVVGLDRGDGSVSWRVDLGVTPRSSGSADDTTLMVLSGRTSGRGDVTLHAVDLTSGTSRAVGSGSSDDVSGARVVAQSDVTLFFDGGRLTSYDTSDGQPNWDRVLGDAIPFVRIGPLGAIVFEQDEDPGATLSVVDLYDGGTQKCTASPNQAAVVPTVTSGRFHLATTGGVLQVLGLDSCDVLWSWDLPTGTQARLPFEVDDGNGTGVLVLDDGTMVGFRLWDQDEDA